MLLVLLGYTFFELSIQPLELFTHVCTHSSSDLPVTHYIYTLCTTSNPQSPQPHRLLQVTVAATSSHTLTRFTEVQPDSASPQACSTLLLAFHPGDRTCLGLIHVQPGTVGIDTCGAAFDEWGMKANM